MEISHETPLCLLKDSLNFNDYQYSLCHLLDQDEEYRNHFLKCKEQGVEIYLDNSLHELGKPYTKERLFYWLDKLQPQYFFIPDHWEDKTQSIVSAVEWSRYQKNYLNTKFIAVVQAHDIHEAVECYQTYKDLGYQKIAFSYGAAYYNDVDLTPHPNKNLGKALGRIQVISKLYNWGVINRTDSIHLLGTSYPGEFAWYKDFPFIESIDTSSPIMATLDGLEYQGYGLDEKPKSNMNNSFYKKKEEINLSLLERNIRLFRIINGIPLKKEQNINLEELH